MAGDTEVSPALEFLWATPGRVCLSCTWSKSILTATVTTVTLGNSVGRAVRTALRAGVRKKGTGRPEATNTSGWFF
jgi:hypothetical protein